MRNQFAKSSYIKINEIKDSAIWKSLSALLAIIVAWMVIAEGIARTPLGKYLPPPSVGADSFEFDIKVYYLEQSIRQRGGLDCLIVGDSMANNGPDPMLIEQAYHEETGGSLRCFNFGMPALTLEASGPLAKALTRKFHPRLLIFILASRDFDSTYGATFRHVAFTDWANYNLGDTTARGWAVNSVYGYRYFLLMNYWLTPSNRENFANSWSSISLLGFTSLYDKAPPREISIEPAEFAMNDPAAQSGFEQLLQIHGDTTSLIIVDAPIQPFYYDRYREIHFEAYETAMRKRFDSFAIPFWATNALSNSIPAEGWYDTFHINQIGSPIFSAWLGRQLSSYYPPSFFK